MFVCKYRSVLLQSRLRQHVSFNTAFMQLPVLPLHSLPIVCSMLFNWVGIRVLLEFACHVANYVMKATAAILLISCSLEIEKLFEQLKKSFHILLKASNTSIAILTTNWKLASHFFHYVKPQILVGIVHLKPLKNSCDL